VHFFQLATELTKVSWEERLLEVARVKKNSAKRFAELKMPAAPRSVGDGKQRISLKGGLRFAELASSCSIVPPACLACGARQ
jgi:hypothetical protein